VASYFIFGEATQDTLWLTGAESRCGFERPEQLNRPSGAFLMMIGTALILKGDTQELKSSNRNEKKMFNNE
jgi:hypothetical protein